MGTTQINSKFLLKAIRPNKNNNTFPMGKKNQLNPYQCMTLGHVLQWNFDTLVK
jgi:hypothetical protein